MKALLVFCGGIAIAFLVWWIAVMIDLLYHFPRKVDKKKDEE